MKSWNHLSFINISPTLVIDTSMERFSRVLHHENPKIWILFKKNWNSNFGEKLKFEFWWKAEIRLIFVNISPTLVIDISMKRFSLVLHHGNSTDFFFFQKCPKFKFWLVTKSWNHLSFVNINPTLVIEASMERFSSILHHGNQKIWIFFKKILN